MPDRNQVKPYHSKETAPGQEAADVVAEVLKHAEAREQASKKKVVPKGPPRWMLPLTLNLGVLALYFIIAQPDFLVLNPVDDPRPPAEVVEAEKRGLYMEIMKILNYQSENGRLPATLAEMGSPLAEQGVDYTVQGDSSFLLIKTVQGEPIVFDSAQDDPATWVGAFRIPG